MISREGWYGLWADGVLIAVDHFSQRPTVLDFNRYYASWINYEITTVSVKPTGDVELGT